MAEKVAIVACTGMGKALASVGRYAALYLTTILRPESTVNVCFPCVTAADDASLELLHQYPAIIIDGCAQTCGSKILAQLGINVIAHLKVWQLMAKYRGLKPDSRVKIGENGKELAKHIAEETALKVDAYLGGE